MTCTHCNLRGHYKPTCSLWLSLRRTQNESAERVLQAAEVAENARPSFELPLTLTDYSWPQFLESCRGIVESDSFLSSSRRYCSECNCTECLALLYVRPDVLAPIDPGYDEWREREREGPANPEVLALRVEAQERYNHARVTGESR